MEGGDGEVVNIEELASNLSTYKEQLEEVRKLLKDDPRNAEFLDMERELVEVIALTEELLATAKQNDTSGLGTGTTEASPSVHLPGSASNVKSTSTADYGGKFPVGTKVQAVWSEDGEWYDATIEALTPNGYYVSYDGWGNREEVDPDNVRPVQEGTADPLLEAEKIAVATKEALKRKIAQAATKDFQSWTLPPKLQIDPNDPEDVKAAKRKKIHAFKSKMRMEAKE
ncbi:Splicing factor SPF30, partial [Handroanthus impetiginosus]